MTYGLILSNDAIQIPSMTSKTENVLFSAVKAQDSDLVRTLLRRETTFNLDAVGEDGLTLLGLAAQNGCLQITETLLKVGSSVNYSDLYGQTALQHAADSGHDDIVRLLIDNGADVNFVDKHNDLSAILLASLKGHVEVVRVLIKAGCNINMQDINGVSALHCAASNEDVDLTRLLLQSKVDVNLRATKTGRIPLLVAVETGNLEVLQLMLAHRAKVNVRDNFRMTPLCVACIQNNTDAGCRLLEHGAKVNMADAHDSLPLHYAARNGNLTLTKCLLEAGSEMDKLNDNFESPLHLAVRSGIVEVVKALVDKGCDCNICEFRGSVTPLQVAVTSASDPNYFDAILQLLLEGGALLDTRAFVSLESALYRAIVQNKTAVARLLLENGADPNIECPFDITVLNQACRRQNVPLVDTLLHCPIDWHREQWLDADIHSSGINPKLLVGYARHIPMDLLRNVPLYSLLRQVRANPPPLVHVCRWAIRGCLRRPLHINVTSLSLPRKLQDYVMMKVL